MINYIKRIIGPPLFFLFDKEFVALFENICSFFLFALFFDFSWRYGHLKIFIESERMIIFSVAGTILGVVAFAFVLSALIRALIAVLGFLDGQKFSWLVYLAMTAAMFFYLFSMIATLAFRGFRLMTVFHYSSYQNIAVIIMFLCFIVLMITNKHGVEQFFLKKVRLSWRIIVVIALFSLSLLLFSFGFNVWGKRPSLIEKRQPNVLLITIDGLSYNHTSLANYRFDTTPNLKNLGKKSYSFNKMHCTKFGTIGNMTSLFSSKYSWPKEYVDPREWFQGEWEEEHMGLLLKKHGYEPYAIFPVGTERIMPDKFLSPFDKKYILTPYVTSPLNVLELYDYWAYKITGANSYLSDLINDYSVKRITLLASVFRTTDYDERIPAMAEEMIKEKRAPFFLWVHAFAPHECNRAKPPKPFQGKFIGGGEMTANYNDLIFYTDYQIGQLIALLKKHDIYNNTIIIITADHGSTLGKHKNWAEAKLNIPLLIHLPGQKKGATLKTLADHTDIAPTICDILDISRPEWMQGAPLLKNGSNQEVKKFNTDLHLIKNKEIEIINGFIVVFSKHHKLIWWPETNDSLLYNLENDPLEKQDISAKFPDVFLKLKRSAKHYLERARKEGAF